MGTRGCYGLRKDGVDKLTYNHMDSYPSWLGNRIVEFIQSTSIEEMKAIFDKIVLVTDKDTPTDAELVEWKLTNRFNGDRFDWYSFLRDSQGRLDYYKEIGNKYMEDSGNFIKDSLFCEWAYIINLDEGVLEVYTGFQKTPHTNRYTGDSYKTNSGDEYFSCRLIAILPLDNIPDGIMEVLEEKCNQDSNYVDESLLKVQK